MDYVTLNLVIKVGRRLLSFPLLISVLNSKYFLLPSYNITPNGYIEVSFNGN